MTDHTPTPWFVSGVRFRMNGGDWQSINRYDESKKQDENIACVGYDPRTGVGFADAKFIVKACNAHDDLLAALRAADQWIKLLVKEMDIEPDDTTVVVNAVSPDGKRELAKMNLAQSQTQFADALAKAVQS